MAVLNDANIKSTDDIMSAIHTFLTSTLTNTWNSVDGIDTGANTMDLDTGNLFLQFTWDGDDINISQSTGSSTPVNFGAEVGDSGFNSNVDFPLVVTNAEIWVFANDVAAAADRYAYCVIEFNRDGRYLHFPIGGQMRDSDKFFVWAGGAFKCGAAFDILTNGHLPWSSTHRGPLLDSTHGTTTNLATMRADTLRGQIAASKWMALTEANPTTIDDTNDGDGDPVSTARCFGRYGPAPSMATFQRGSPNTASVNLIPLLVCFSPSNLQYMPLGNLPDVRVCNIGSIQPKEQITIGSDTWKFFPWGQKLTLLSDQDELATRNSGIAYLVT